MTDSVFILPMNEAISKLIRKHYKQMEGYVSAGMEIPKDEKQIFLNANENPYPLPGLEGLNRYPEPQSLPLLLAMAENYEVEADQIVITRGADEAISILIKVFCDPEKDSIIINPPTFGIYSVDANAMPAGIVKIPLIKEGNNFALDKGNIIKAALDPENNVKLVFICSPNNPTGTSFSHDVIAEICDELEGRAIIVLDETYAEFSKAGSMCGDLDSTPNLVILRTLSKSYAFAGMRVGCFINTDKDFIQLVRTKVLEAYPLTRLSIEAALHVLSPDIKKIAHANIAKILIERKRVQEKLQRSALIKRIYESDANFLLVEMEKAEEFYSFAKNNNVILRDFSSKPDTRGCIRISIGTTGENDRLIELLDMFEAKIRDQQRGG